MKLILVRHGETEENRDGVMQGHLPGKLSENGISQAKKVAERLKDEKIDYIYSSDLARAADTAKEISKFHPDVKIEFIEDLRERHMGNYQGKKKSDFGWDKNQHRGLKLSGGNVESIESLSKRVKKFLDMVLSKHKNNSVLIVAHGGTLKILTTLIENKGLEEVESLQNTSVSEFEINSEGYKNHRYNCTKHLD